VHAPQKDAVGLSGDLSKVIHPLRILYIFAGKGRHSDLRHYLSQATDFVLVMQELDILRGGDSHDVLSAQVSARILDDIRASKFDVVVCTPPCNTWTRSVWSNRAGPRPIRSRQHSW